ncbi:unnamed protein product, partial [Urochloa humidicola]
PPPPAVALPTPAPRPCARLPPHLARADPRPVPAAVAVPPPPLLARSEFSDDFLVGCKTPAAVYEDRLQNPTVLRGEAQLAKDFKVLVGSVSHRHAVPDFH